MVADTFLTWVVTMRHVPGGFLQTYGSHNHASWPPVGSPTTSNQLEHSRVHVALALSGRGRGRGCWVEGWTLGQLKTEQA